MDGDLEIIFKQSAFKHGVTEADIHWAKLSARIAVLPDMTFR